LGRVICCGLLPTTIRYQTIIECSHRTGKPQNSTYKNPVINNTANDVAGAYLLDWYAASSKDISNKWEDLVGLSGCLFALSFLGPRSGQSERNGRTKGGAAGVFWDGLHFVGSLSIYDTMLSFNYILQGSIVSENHSMIENQRISFFALRDLVGTARAGPRQQQASMWGGEQGRPFCQ
jgi:hypothetical protein